MERSKGGCCLAPRYGAAATGQAWQQAGNVVLKFRPIAPKPAAMAPPAPMPLPPVTTAGKGKRKAVAGRRGRKPKKATPAVAAVLAKAAAPALTQKVDDRRKKEDDKPLSSSPSSSSSSTPPPTLVHAAPTADLAPARAVGHAAAAAPRPLRPVASCVTVESVTGTWRDGGAPSGAASCVGGGDEAPAFVSDRWGRVTWMNLAFSRAVSAAGVDAAPAAPPAPDVNAGVVLAAKDGAAVPPWGTCPGFTCRVRVAYRRSSLVAPCDVWRLDAAGCYLWRLDLQATLTLSLGGLLYL